MAKTHVPMEVFITVWEQNDSAKAVSEKTGIKLTSVLARASKYRADGIPLKFMKRGGGGAKLDIAKAQALIASLRNVQTEGVVTESAEKPETTPAE